MILAFFNQQLSNVEFRLIPCGAVGATSRFQAEAAEIVLQNYCFGNIWGAMKAFKVKTVFRNLTSVNSD